MKWLGVIPLVLIVAWLWRSAGYREVEGAVDPAPDFVTGHGQKLYRVHDSARCAPGPCVIHNPSDHSMRSFPTLWRGDRALMERICPHGVGHPDPDQPLDDGRGVHGCDGCCRALPFDQDDDGPQDAA